MNGDERVTTDECAVTAAKAITAGLTNEALARRLGELALAERRVQVEFLLDLEEFDRRRAYLEIGYGSLWEYCLRALHLREGSAGRRIGAMRVLRRFPGLAEPLRDGRLCLSTAALLGQVLTDANLAELVARAAYKTKQEVDQLVATLRPRLPTREGIRQLPAPFRVTPAASESQPLALGTEGVARSLRATDQRDSGALDLGDAEPRSDGRPVATDEPSESDSQRCTVTGAPGELSPAPTRPPTQVRALSETQWSLTVTLDVTAKKDLELLGALLSHKCGRNLSAVLREAIRCGIEKHGKRRGAVPPQRGRDGRSPRAANSANDRQAAGPITSASPPEERTRNRAERTSKIPERTRKRAERTSKIPERTRNIPAEVRRQVFERDCGCCTWVGHGGRRCGSRYQVELDHIHPFELGGLSTVANLRLLCKAHNLLYAEQVYGREHIARFRSREPRPGRVETRSLARATETSHRTVP